MRKNIATVIAAWKQGVAKKGDSKATCWTDGVGIYSYDLLIVKRYHNGLLWVLDSHSTMTTKSQLSAIDMEICRRWESLEQSPRDELGRPTHAGRYVARERIIRTPAFDDMLRPVARNGRCGHGVAQVTHYKETSSLSSSARGTVRGDAYAIDVRPDEVTEDSCYQNADLMWECYLASEKKRLEDLKAANDAAAAQRKADGIAKRKKTAEQKRAAREINGEVVS